MKWQTWRTVWISVTVTVTITQQPCHGSDSESDPVRRHLQINGNYLWAISKSQSKQSRALINFSTHTRDGMYRMSRLWPARVSSAHQLGHLISAARPSSKLNWDIYNMQSSAVKNEMLQKIQMEIGMINSGRRRPTVVMTARETVKVARKVPPGWGRKLLPQVEGKAVKTSRLKLRRVEWAAACLMAF